MCSPAARARVAVVRWAEARLEAQAQSSTLRLSARRELDRLGARELDLRFVHRVGLEEEARQPLAPHRLHQLLDAGLDARAILGGGLGGVRLWIVVAALALSQRILL